MKATENLKVKLKHALEFLTGRQKHSGLSDDF